MDKLPPILVLGGCGQLGRELATRASELGKFVQLDIRDLDLTDRDAVVRRLDNVRPRLIINTAAYTAVDKAEVEPDLAEAVNGGAVGLIAKSCREIGASLIQVSTDYVFDGSGDKPIREDDPTRPLNTYGRSKLAGEVAARAELDAHVILRTSSLFSPFGANFVKTMVGLRGRNRLNIIDDQTSGPTSAASLAQAIVRIVKRLAMASDDCAALYGTYHFCGRPAATWFEIARAIFDHLALDGEAVPELVPTTAAAWGAPAPRPVYSVLDCTKIRTVFGIEQPDWRDEMAIALNRLTKS